MEQILLAYGLPKETVAAITILYRNTKVKVRSPDRDTEYFDIVAGVLQDRNATNMDKLIKGKCPHGVCSGEGEYITRHTCSNGNELDMDPATTCDCGREFNSLRGLRIHKARWCKQRNSPTG